VKGCEGAAVGQPLQGSVISLADHSDRQAFLFDKHNSTHLNMNFIVKKIKNYHCWIYRIEFQKTDRGVRSHSSLNCLVTKSIICTGIKNDDKILSLVIW
jgi:hypothetical protein